MWADKVKYRTKHCDVESCHQISVHHLVCSKKYRNDGRRLPYFCPQNFSLLIKINGAADDINSALPVCIDLVVMLLALGIADGASKRTSEKKDEC